MRPGVRRAGVSSLGIGGDVDQRTGKGVSLLSLLPTTVISFTLANTL